MKHNPFASLKPEERFVAYSVVAVMAFIVFIVVMVLAVNFQQKIRESRYSEHLGTDSATANDGNSLVPVAVVNPGNATTTNAASASLAPVLN